MKNLAREAKQILDTIRPTIRDLALKLHRYPELSMQEFKACRWQVELLRKWKFRVKSPYKRLDTAYRADIGRGGPVICYMAEYDALPGLGHGCGHNLIAAAGVGAGYLLSRLLQSHGVKGTVTVMGTPGEEGFGGKVILTERGALKNVDAALMCHPDDRCVPDTPTSAVERFEVTFRGKSVHAADPADALNPLDAVNLLYSGVSAWRQQLPESARVHGVITDGGVKPNIIPESTSCQFYLRSPDDRYVSKMARRFRDIIKGAGLMTGTAPEIRSWGVACKARKPNRLLNEAWAESAGLAGLEVTEPEPIRGSSDFGNVSQTVPGIHPRFSISRTPIPSHSPRFTRAAGSRLGIENMFRMTVAMALAGCRFMTDEKFRQAVAADFRSTKPYPASR